jgi:hypothetical protein
MRGVVGGLGTRYASAGRVRTRAIGAALSMFAGGVYVYSIVMSKTVRGARVIDWVRCSRRRPRAAPVSGE